MSPVPQCRIGACIWSLDGVSSLCRVDTVPSCLARIHVLQKTNRRFADCSPPPRPERLKVHVSWGGVFTLVEERLFETEVGQRVLREADELERRLRGKPSAGGVAPTASDRPPTGD